MKTRGCFCFNAGNIKEKSLEKLKRVVKKIVQDHSKKIEKHEHIIGYEDLPVYSENGNIFQYDGRSARFYFYE